MVNKPHAPRPTKSSKKPVAASANGEDTSYIVFSNDTRPAKEKRKDVAPPSSNPADASAPPDAEKKPDVKTLIAGPSWTGKLPMTLFNELCQKQKWDKPEYTVHRGAKGFTGAIILRQRNPKTREVVTLPPILPPKDYDEHAAQPSAIEARHFAAAYALFRISNMKNIHMMLPPRYRDLWKGDFQDLKSAAIAQGLAYQYEADPFLAKKQHDDAKLAKEKARAANAKQREEEEKQVVVSLDGQVQSRHVLKGWQRVPKVELGLRSRREMERLLREQGVWNAHAHRLDAKQARIVVDELSAIGFRRSHVEEATDICKGREECLEWLLVHVPEDDLPKWTLPDNYLAGVSLASSDLKREGKLKRLAAGGYAMELCADVLDTADGDETRAAEVLQHRLLADDAIELTSTASGAVSQIWTEEQEALTAIYGDRFHSQDRQCTIELELQGPDKAPILLRARSPGPHYPSRLPIIAVEAKLPAYIRLSILKQCLIYGNDHFLGEQMLFNLVDWLEREIPSVIERPGKLSEIASAASISAEPAQARKQAQSRPRRHPRLISWTPNTSQSTQLLAEWRARQTTPNQQRMLQTRQGLPAWRKQDIIVSTVTANQVTIISGETGSGKSTQSVQFILDDLLQRSFGEQANIICTQPRRISALGLADRVADERCGQVGDEIGYAIRGETKHRQGRTKICFVTTGVLLQRLKTSGGRDEDVVVSLADVSHVVIDEVHERSLDTDFLLVLLKSVLPKRRDLKLILMSATLDAAVFKTFFQGVSTVGSVEIEGRTHPVEDIYLDEIVRATGFDGTRDFEDAEDSPNDAIDRNSQSIPATSLGSALRAVGTRINYDLIAATVRHIDHELGDLDGGILIFLPGVAEIDQALRALRSVAGMHAIPLHASLPSSEQRLVFKKPPSGLRKVVVATNIAETSITIDDILAVIDTGRVKETSFDPANNMVRLSEVWASRAACKQRRGRAGRVRAGKCYKLYTRSAEAKMAERPDPEIRRVPLEQLCLSVKAMGVRDVSQFLASALTPPESLSVEGALAMLSRMGALDDGEVTSLGWHLSRIPADLRCAKLMVYGAAFGCLDACITLAAILTVKSPFVNPQAKRDESKAARAAFGDGQGDLICDLRAYQDFDRRRDGTGTSALRRWCSDHFLHFQTLLDISTNRMQYISALREIGFVEGGRGRFSVMTSVEAGEHSSDALLRALIAGAFQPQVARIDFPDKKFAASSSGAVELDPEARTIKFFNQENGRVFVHPSSTLFDAQAFPGSSVFMSYFTKMATSKVFIRDLTPFNVFSLLMFSGPIDIDPQGRGLVIDGWLRLRGWARIGVLVSRLRLMLDDLLSRKIDDPSMNMSETGVVKVVRRLVELDGLDR